MTVESLATHRNQAPLDDMSNFMSLAANTERTISRDDELHIYDTSLASIIYPVTSTWDWTKNVALSC